ncbi:P63C domain-containing protein [Rhodoferax sp. UBA5149]|uniref:P63C domain-containing protein n=1 Tax=Rhodoferax sp. UBA5149 TaxID=1947379 RepID=UPI0025DA49DA|nr:P63C domain-containing protein [Rhodoferax sp. UBA5149]
MKTPKKDASKAIGGIARSASLSPEERKAIASKAALARWSNDPQDTQVASHEGEFDLGEAKVQCAVLPNGTRVITQATFLRAIGRSRSPKAGTGVLSTVDELPFFLSADVLKPFIDAELAASTTPIFYRSKSGSKGVGYDASLLPKVAEVYLRFRDRCLAEKGTVPKNYQHIVKASDILMRGLANVGIIALVDEATGFQRERAKDALAKILEKFIAEELQPWTHTFTSEYYEHMFRLRGLSYPQDSVRRPAYFGHLTNNIVYARLAPKVLEQLKKETPRSEKTGRHTNQLHRKLTPDIGHPKLKEHLAAVVSLMRISSSYKQFEHFLDIAHPKFNDTLPLFDDQVDDGMGL